MNQDSLNQLTTELSSLNAQIKDIDDSVKAINTLIAGGDQTDYTDIKDSLSDQKEALTAEKNKVNSTIKVIKSGKIGIDKLSAEGSASDILYEDSLTSYKFPLNSNADFSRIFVTIGDSIYTVDASYTRETIVKERAVVIKANQFEIVNVTFDSVKISQPDSTNFSSNEATATLYF